MTNPISIAINDTGRGEWGGNGREDSIRTTVDFKNVAFLYHDLILHPSIFEMKKWG